MTHTLMYKVCYRTITSGNAPADMEDRLYVFLGADKISIEEFDELMELLHESE